MKIYIDNYNNEKMTKKLGSFNKYLLNKTNVIEVYSDEGIYLVDPKTICPDSTQMEIGVLQRPTSPLHPYSHPHPHAPVFYPYHSTPVIKRIISNHSNPTRSAP